MHLDFVLPCNCLSSRQFSRVKIVHYYISATVIARNPTPINKHIKGVTIKTNKMQEIQTIPGQLGCWRVDNILYFNAHLPRLPCVKEVTHLQHTHNYYVQFSHFIEQLTYPWLILWMYVYDETTIETRMTPGIGSHSYLAGLEEVKANVWVTCGRIHTVMTEVLTDVFWRGLGQ